MVILAEVDDDRTGLLSVIDSGLHVQFQGQDIFFAVITDFHRASTLNFTRACFVKRTASRAILSC
jgi:hypothetical protein